WLAARLSLATDRNGRWLMTWHEKTRDGEDSAPIAVFVARSDDAGFHWTQPKALSPGEPSEWRLDMSASVAFSHERWGVAWISHSGADGNGFDADVLAAFSTDGGDTWSAPRAIDTEANTDSRMDAWPVLAASDS